MIRTRSRALMGSALAGVLLLAAVAPASAVLVGPSEFTWTLDESGTARFDACGSNGGAVVRILEYKWVVFQYLPSSDTWERIHEETLLGHDASGSLCDDYSYRFTESGHYRVVVDILVDSGERDYTDGYLEIDLPQADLGVTVSESADPVTEGHAVTYTIELTNHGPDTARGVALTNIVSPPADASWSLSTDGGMDCSSGSGLGCTEATIAPGDTRTLRITARLNEPGTLRSSAHVRSDTADPDTSNDNASESTTVISAQADLGVTVSESADPVTEGHAVTYTIELTNHGPDTARGVALTNIVSPPADASWSLSTDGGMDCSSGSGLGCTEATIAPGDTRTLRITARLNEPGTLRSSAHVRSDTADPDTSNDNASESTTVISAQADLGVTVSESADPVTEGHAVTYTIELTNHGPDTARGVALTNIVSPPADASWSLSTDGGMDCSSGSGLGCTEATIAPGDTRTLRITARLNEPGTLRSSAHVRSDTADPDTSNDNASESTTVISADQVPPVVIGVPGREPDAHGWYARAVTIDWQSTDPDPSSGTPSDPPDTRAETEGRDVEYTSERSCDPVGNCARGSLALTMDTTAPDVTCESPVPTFGLQEPDARVRARVSDALSGPVDGAVAAMVDTTSVGERTVDLSGRDLAGHETTVSCPYIVAYRFDGFYPPVDGGGVLNVVKAGRAVPLKWRLTDVSDAPFTGLSTATVTVKSLDCSLGTSSDVVPETTAGESGLQDLGDGLYQLNWKTPSSYAGSCKTMRLDLGEGVVHTALFKFTR